MSTTLARAPEVEPATPPNGPAVALLDAGLITRLGRGVLPEVVVVGAPDAPAPSPRRRNGLRRSAPAGAPRPPAARPPLGRRPIRPLPLPGSPVAAPAAPRRPAAAAAPAVAPGAAAALPELAPWITGRPAGAPPTAMAVAVVVAAPVRRAPARAGTRRRRRGLLPTGLVLAGVAAIAAVAAAAGLVHGTGGTGASGPAPSGGPSALMVMTPTPTALREIPPDYLQLYMRIGSEMDIDWRFLAAIGAQESDHGRNPAANRVNRSGCVGPMQIGVGGECGNFLQAWGTDGDGDGRIDARDPADAIATAAHGLRDGKGAPGVGGAWSDYLHAACGYYGACSDVHADYAREVMRRAVSYGLPPRT